MQLTLELKEPLASALQRFATDSGCSLEEAVNHLVATGLGVGKGSKDPYRIKPVSLGAVAPGLDLDKATALADSLDDLNRIRKLKTQSLP